MPGPRLHTLALGASALAGGAALWLAGCQDAGPAAGHESKVTVTGADGVDTLTLALEGDTCNVGGEVKLAVTRTAKGAEARGNAGSLFLEPSRTAGDQQVAGVDGVARLRVHTSERGVDLLGADDIPIARVALDGDGAKIVDRARAPVAVLAKQQGSISITAPDGAAIANVSGTSDLAVAALLTTPGVDADARGLLACERLLPASQVK